MRLGVFFGGSNDVHRQIQEVVEAEQDGFDGMWFGQIFGPDALAVIAMAG